MHIAVCLKYVPDPSTVEVDPLTGGDKIEVKKDPWIKGFDGKSLADPAPDKWAVKKDGGVFDQFAGATITPRAVVKAVKGGMDFYVAHREAIFGGRS